MNDFAQLYLRLDATTSTAAKVDAMVDYLARAPHGDAAWAVYLLAGGKPRQAVPTAVLRALACELAGLSDWLFEECYQAVGDLAETIALVLPAELPPAADADAATSTGTDAATSMGEAAPSGLAGWMEQALLPLRGLGADEVARRMRGHWARLDGTGRFLLTKLVGGGFRVGVSRLLVQRALARHAGLDAKLIAQRMMGYTDARRLPDAQRFAALIAPARAAPAVAQPGDAAGLDGHAVADEPGQPYPFFLAHALDTGDEHWQAKLGVPDDWLVEWKYDGIRAQLVRRAGQSWLWSRGEELITDRFPEIAAMAAGLPDGTVLDGELLVWLPDRPTPAPFALLQQRIGRKTISRALLQRTPCTFVAYDLLERSGQDLRSQAQWARRAALEQLLEGRPAGPALRLSPRVTAPDWAALAQQRGQARAQGVEGLMLKHRDSAYGVGRTKAQGIWWKWKTDPMSVDCVLIYAQAGHGRRASVYTDYTFAVWSRPPRDAAQAQAVVDAIERREPAGELQLVPFAKAYSGLSDAEFKRVDALIRRSTIDKFGPVRSVRPQLVFELGFEGINASTRHKSGLAVRFPRMLRIRDDKPLHEAGCLADLQMLLNLEQDNKQSQGPDD